MFQPEEIQLLILDMNAIAYAAAYQPNLAKLEHAGQPTGVILGAINSFLMAVEAHPKALPLALWDGRAAWRLKHCPGYKSSRSDSPEKVAIKDAVKAQTPAIQLLLNDLGAVQARHPNAEADDLAGCVARQAECAGVPTRMITVDTDWWQGISPMVEWKHAREDIVLDLAGFSSFVNKKTPPDGWRSPAEYLQAKIIAGDSSDDIPGIQGAGMPTAAKLLRTAPEGLDGILRGDFSAKGVVADRLRTPEAQAMLQANRIIIDWTLAPIHDPSIMALWRYEENVEAARATAASFGLKRLGDRVRPGLVPVTPAHAPKAWDVVLRALHWPLQSADVEEVDMEPMAA